MRIAVVLFVFALSHTAYGEELTCQQVAGTERMVNDFRAPRLFCRTGTEVLEYDHIKDIWIRLVMRKKHPTNERKLGSIFRCLSIQASVGNVYCLSSGSVWRYDERLEIWSPMAMDIEH